MIVRRALLRVKVMGSDASKTKFWHRKATQAIAAFVLLWTICVGFLASVGGNFLFPVSSFLMFGIVLTGATVLLTRKADAPTVPVARPKQESVTLLAYTAVYALLIFGPLSGMLRASMPPGPAVEFVMLAYKLLVHVAIPAL